MLFQGDKSGRGEFISAHLSSAFLWGVSFPLLPQFTYTKSSSMVPFRVLRAGEVEDFSTSSIMATIPQHFWSWKGAS